jgi:hypothetical protein
VLRDYTTAPIGDGLRATLGLLKKMTSITPVLDRKTSGRFCGRASRQAIQTLSAFLFNVYDRLAGDGLGRRP